MSNSELGMIAVISMTFIVVVSVILVLMWAFRAMREDAMEQEVREAEKRAFGPK